MFNSREYEWADLSLSVGGQALTGFRAVKYKTTLEKEAIYAKGRDPHSIQKGNNAYDGEISLLQSELEALIDSGNGSILGLSVDAEVSYGNPPGAIRTDRILGLQFTEEPKELSQGDKFMEITLPFIALKINNNV